MVLQANLRAGVLLRAHRNGESLNDIDGLRENAYTEMGNVVILGSGTHPSKVDIHDLLPGGNILKRGACATIHGFPDRCCVQENVDLRLEDMATYGSDSSSREVAQWASGCRRRWR